MKEKNKEIIKSTPIEIAGKSVSIGLNLVPVVGGVLSDIANEIISRRQNRRLNDFLINLSNELKTLSDKLNSDFIYTEEFQDFVEDIFSKAAETRQKEKLESLKNIFINTIISKSVDYDEAVEMITLIVNWQPRHIILLKILNDPIGINNSLSKPAGDGGGFSTTINSLIVKLLPLWTEDQIERTWNDLYDKGVINTQGTKTMMTDRGIYQLENRLSGYGKIIVKYILR